MALNQPITFYLFGGGCYGRLHADHLMKAREKGKVYFDRICIIDRNPDAPACVRWVSHKDVSIETRDWIVWLVDYFARGRAMPSDELVLPCIGPHLLFHTIKKLIEMQTHYHAVHLPWEGRIGIPFEMTLSSGMHAVSYALWRCPSTCIEPEICPGNGKLRNWEMRHFLKAHASTWRVGETTIDHIEIFFSRHRAWGVATLPVAEVLQAIERIMERLKNGNLQNLAVATVSSCHGLIGLMHIRPAGQEVKESDQHVEAEIR